MREVRKTRGQVLLTAPCLSPTRLAAHTGHVAEFPKSSTDVRLNFTKRNELWAGEPLRGQPRNPASQMRGWEGRASSLTEEVPLSPHPAPTSFLHLETGSCFLAVQTGSACVNQHTPSTTEWLFRQILVEGPLGALRGPVAFLKGPGAFWFTCHALHVRNLAPSQVK